MAGFFMRWRRGLTLLFSQPCSASQSEKRVLDYAILSDRPEDPSKQAAQRLACYSCWRDETSVIYS